MTRNGKIARLPKAVRDQLNQRLADGMRGNQLVAWLNGLPEVTEVLAAEFAGEPLNEANLTRWKQGGYRDWTLQQEALELCDLADDASVPPSSDSEPLSERIGGWLAARYAVFVRQFVRNGDEIDWHRLRELCGDVGALRRGDHGAQRLNLGWQRLEQQRARMDQARERLYDEWAKDPAALKALRGPELSPEEKEERLRAIMSIA